MYLIPSSNHSRSAGDAGVCVCMRNVTRGQFYVETENLIIKSTKEQFGHHKWDLNTATGAAVAVCLCARLREYIIRGILLSHQ